MDRRCDIALVDELRSQPAETPWLEFKINLGEPKQIGKLISALSNGAVLEEKEKAFLVWGIEDKTHAVKGTKFNPFSKKIENEEFEFWLQKRLKPAPEFKFRSVAHPDGNVILLEIPAAMTMPTAYNDIAYIRVGSATPKLSDHPGKHERLIGMLRSYAWEHGAASSYLLPEDVLGMLDFESYFSLTEQPRPETQDRILERLEADRLIKRNVGGRWDILNLGAVLFAADIGQFNGNLARKAVRVIRYKGVDRAATVTHRQDERKGYAAGFEHLLAYVNGFLPQNEHIDQALRVSQPPFPPRAVRELVANALIHQDMTITGAGPRIELFEDRIEITNPGRPLIDADRMIDLPPRSRNEALADLMRRMKMCEEQGSGLDKVFTDVEISRLPAPLLKATENAMQVVLYGPRTFAEMSADERIKACYWHSVLKFVSGGKRMKNSTLRKRLGIAKKNAAQATVVINKALKAGLIKYADEEHPKAGYHPSWA